MFDRGLFKNNRRHRFSGPVKAIDLLNEKSKYLKGDIVIGHCKGHDRIILFFHFEGFYENHRRFFPKTFTLDKKIMGSSCSRKRKLNVKIIDTIDKGEEFDYLRPKRRLVYKIDSVYNVPKIDIYFDGWYANSVRLWHKN